MHTERSVILREVVMRLRPRRCRWYVSLSVALLGLFPGTEELAGQEIPTSTMVAVGAGSIGTWNTEFEVANATGRNLDVILSWVSNPGAVCIPGVCPVGTTIQPNGSGKLLASTVLGSLPFVGSFYLVSDPQAADDYAVRARVFNTVRPTEAIEIPVFRLSTLISLNPGVLAFPSATRSNTAHSNLVLAEVAERGTLSMLVEAFSVSGQLLGGLPVEITADPQDTGRRSVFLMDVLSTLGITELSGGQIRVTKLGGEGVMWGLLATVFTDGRVIVSLGQNP
jgi:hypothetical protein